MWPAAGQALGFATPEPRVSITITMVYNPGFWQGTADTCDISWVKELGRKTWCSLWRSWSNICPDDLPQGYDLYLISYYFESIDLEWVQRQSRLISAPIVLISDSCYYDWPHSDNVFCYTMYHWHNQIECLKQWFPYKIDKNIRYKISSVSNRITQSKSLIHSAISRYIDKQNSLCILGQWINEENFYTGDHFLDSLIDEFFDKHYGQQSRIDQWNDSLNLPTYTGNPWTTIYQDCAIHATNESYHYSFSQTEQGSYIIPGPFITEKTLKCLLGATAFISVGQFDVYRTFETLGCKFDYGLDLSFDQDPGNITRLKKIIQVIKNLADLETMEVFKMTEHSSEYNQSIMFDRTFYQNCQNRNQTVIEKIMVNHKP